MGEALNWMHTSTGGKMYPGSPAQGVRISDIANGLALTCRYSGQGDVEKFYSVAEHSVLMAEYALQDVGPHAAMYALLHDAAEAYMGDLVPAVKNALGGSWKSIEDGITDCIMRKYSVRQDFKRYVKVLDMRMVPVEKAVLMRHPQEWPSDVVEPLPVCLRLQTPAEAKVSFLLMWEELRQMNGLPIEHWEI